MNVSVYSLIFRDYKFEDFLKTMVEIGYGAIEIRVHEDNVHLSPLTSIEEAKKLKKIIEDYGLTVCALAGYKKLGYELKKASQELKLMVKTGKLADIFNAPIFRIKIRGYDPSIGYEKIRKLVREQIEELYQMLKKEGVESKPVIEQHGGGDMAHSTGLLVDLLRGIEPEKIGVLFDPGNAVKVGWLPLELQIDMIKDYIKHVHVKNYEWSSEEPGKVVPSPLDRGIVDWKKAVEILSSYGYKGYYSLEDFRPLPPEERARQALQFFKSLNL